MWDNSQNVEHTKLEQTIISKTIFPCMHREKIQGLKKVPRIEALGSQRTGHVKRGSGML